MQLSKHEIGEEIRKTGIDVIGDAPWGTHFCQFYEAKEDLIAVLVPYFKAGLENNEFCMWVTSEPLSENEAKEAMRKAVPDFDRYLERGQIEIVPHIEWYLKDGVFNLRRVLNAWIDKLDQALAKGYDGIRVTGNTAWLEKKGWRSFVDYEEEVNDVIGKYRMMAICTYSLDKCGASEVIDVVRNHQFALIKRRGEWELIESSERKKAEEALRKSEEKYRSIVELAPDGIVTLDMKGVITSSNTAATRMTGYSKHEIVGKHFSKLGFLRARDVPKYLELLSSAEKGKVPESLEVNCIRKDGTPYLSEVRFGLLEEGGKTIGFQVIGRDITERKKAEEALKESEEKFKSLVQTIPECVYSALPTGEILYMSPSVKTIFGYSAEEMQKDKNLWIRLIHKDDQKELLTKLEKLIKKGVPYVHEFRMKRKDGTIVWIRDHANAALDEKGKPTKISGIIYDITERKRAEEALRESEEKFRNIFEGANDCIAYLDISGRILEVNEKAVELFGGSKKELLGKHFTRVGVLSPGDRPRVMSAFVKALAGKKPIVDTWIKNKKGREIYVEVSGSLMKLNGKPGILVIARDVTERKKAEEIIRESEEKLRGIFSTMPDGVTLVGLDGKILDCNDAVLRLHGVSRDEYVGTNVYDFIALEDRQRAIQEASIVLEKGFIRSEVKAFKKEGGTFDAEINVSMLRDASGKPMAFLGVTRDVTERKRMEEEFRESEERFRNLFESIQDPVGVYVGREGRLIEYNKAFNKLSGYTDEELKGKPFLDFVHPDDHALVLERYRTKYPEEELPLVYEIRAVNKKGETIPIEISVSTYKVKDKVIGIEVIHRDITERKKAEEELIRLSSAVKMSTDSIVISDLDGNIIDANEATLKMYGTDDKEDLIGRNSFDLIAPEEREKALAGMEETLEKGYVKGREYHIITKDGSRIPVEMSVAIMKDADGKPIGFVGISRDITERKEMEEKLRQYSEHLEELVQKRTEELLESEKRYSVLVEEASDGVVMIQDGKTVFTNKKLSEIVGHSRDELIRLPLEKVIDKKYCQSIKEMDRQIIRGGKVPSTYEIEVIAKSGERIPVEGSPTRINYQGRPAVLVIVRDVRERKRMEEERLKLEKLATIGELATMVGHDLRNPLQSIENATYYLNNELPSLSPSTPIPQKAIEMLQIINDSVNYADKIVRDLHDFAAAKKPILKKININTIVKETLSQVKAPENVRLITELGHLPEIKADKDMIKRAFLNLAINGIQAMEKGGTLKVSTKKTGGFVEVSFKDNGVGMSKEDMKKLFTPFFTTRAKGMGMGLPICKKFVDAHGGTIEVESQEGKGTTFTVKLPIQQEVGGETSGEE